MDQSSLFFQGGTTLVDPVALAFTLSLGIALFGVPRRWVLVPLCLTLVFVPMQQRIVLGGLDFDFGRIMLLFGWARIVVRGEIERIRFTPLDKCFVAWLVIGTIFYFLGAPSTGALVYRAGIMLDAMGMYFLCRMVVRSPADIGVVLAALCWISLAISPFMLVESRTGYNLFAFLGGVEAESIVRDGRVRAQGSLAHPIMAGTFGATLFPLAVALWFARPRSRLTAAAGVVGSLAVTLLVASSGPVIAIGVAMVGWALWIARDWMRLVRWGVVAILTTLHLIREAPVWHLIGRLSDVMGGTGWHRYALIDAFINNWREWILFGLGTRSTGTWGWGLEDLTNQFVFEGVRGGLATLLAFVALLVAGFSAVSKTMARASRESARAPARARSTELLAWGLGCALAAHCASWISVSYYGQMWSFLYLHLGLVAALSTAEGVATVRAPVARPAPADEPPAPPPPAWPSYGDEAPALGRSLVGPGRARFAGPRGAHDA